MAKELSKEELLKFLDNWTYLKRVTVIDLPEWWGTEKDKQAYQQLVRLISADKGKKTTRNSIKPKVSKEFVENLGHELYDLPRYDMVINRLTKRLKEAGIEVEE